MPSVTAPWRRRMSRSVSWSQSGTERGIPGKGLPALIGSFPGGAVMAETLLWSSHVSSSRALRAGPDLRAALLEALAQGCPSWVTLVGSQCWGAPWAANPALGTLVVLPGSHQLGQHLNPCGHSCLHCWPKAGGVGTSPPSGDNAGGAQGAGTLQAVLPAQQVPPWPSSCQHQVGWR